MRLRTESKGKGNFYAEFNASNSLNSILRLVKATQQIQHCLSANGLQAYAALEDLKTTLELWRTK